MRLSLLQDEVMPGKVEKKHECRLIITYTDGSTFDYSIGANLSEIVAALPKSARSHEQYRDLVKENVTAQMEAKAAFCEDFVIHNHSAKCWNENGKYDGWKQAEMVWSERPKKLVLNTRGE